ncbi:class I SAM-dependent methyltransferase [Sinorhizobium chiapasense]|uniref:Class I SAM-dependent methyltransferase n=1 Tax=Sinorhizobium chiapasense TaxID=501572 RepID=A0ABZ2BC60_9HYPH
MPEHVSNGILEHNREAAAIWGAGGLHYDLVSFAISDALAHAAQRLNPKPGDKVLDVATGTGWSARNAARLGANVTAIDISADLIDAARLLSTGIEPPIDYHIADAENLPFPDESFDKVLSTFGVIFAGNHRRAANELARVCRKGGRLSISAWSPTGAVARFFAVIGAHTKAPPPTESPLSWGDPAHIEDLLGKEFTITFEHGTNNVYHDSVEDIWNWYIRGFGPLRTLYEGLNEGERAALKRDVDAYHAHYQVEAGLHIKREYLIVIGEKR